MKIMIRGGSIPAGLGVKKSYVDLIREDGRFSNDIIVNCSRYKETTFEAVWNYSEEIRPQSPEVLLLHFGMDDMFRPVYRSEFKENLVQLVRLARKEFNPTVLLATSHLFENRYEMDTLDIYYRTIREVAVDLDCRIVPVHTFWASFLYKTGKLPNEIVQQDTRYPNEQGQEIYAAVIIKSLLRVKGFLV